MKNKTSILCSLLMFLVTSCVFAKEEQKDGKTYTVKITEATATQDFSYLTGAVIFEVVFFKNGQWDAYSDKSFGIITYSDLKLSDVVKVMKQSQGSKEEVMSVKLGDLVAQGSKRAIAEQKGNVYNSTYQIELNGRLDRATNEIDVYLKPIVETKQVNSPFLSDL